MEDSLRFISELIKARSSVAPFPAAGDEQRLFGLGFTLSALSLTKEMKCSGADSAALVTTSALVFLLPLPPEQLSLAN